MTPIFAAFILTCPVCGAQIIPHSIRDPREPELYHATCKSCGALIEAKRDPETGRLIAQVASPS